MHDAPTEEDIIFFIGSQKHKTVEINAITKAFGEHKADAVEAVLRLLVIKGVISRTGEASNIITLS